ncbi:DMT family transporter [Thalassobacter sp. 16PALIMAR09]|uniref:DMT family transporter n=1 Tax=Thalassobacter sp. 16PALIMAR09 TaxID=1225651 RepID=UPI001F31CEDF|nr:DMT family transporter [Thalassobacter sp. 16PALIMAR09]
MAILLGLTAALAWGIHDLCVRQVSQGTGIFASIVAVLIFGTLLVTPMSLWAWDAPRGPNALPLGLASGVLFGLAAIAHYKAFSIGPVRLVAPIIGAYPALSVGWAVYTGTPVSALQLLAVGIIIAGVGYVARAGDNEAARTHPGPAILWSILAGTGFAATFAVGQAATAEGGELALLAPTRIAALIVVLAIAAMGRVPILPGWTQIRILAAMGALDALALGAVISAGGVSNPELASVLAATFGLITVVLAALFLREPMMRRHWTAVALVFAAIAYLAT